MYILVEWAESGEMYLFGCITRLFILEIFKYFIVKGKKHLTDFIKGALFLSYCPNFDRP